MPPESRVGDVANDDRALAWQAERKIVDSMFVGVDEDEFAVRRRKRHCDAIREIGLDRVDEVWKALAVNNVSFDN